MVHSHTVSELVGLELLAPLTEWIQRDGEIDVEDLFPEAVEEFSHNGVLYAVPYEYHMVAALFYNADAFAESGLAPPPAEWPWQQFLQDARKLIRYDGDEVARWAIYTYHPLNFVHSWGRRLGRRLAQSHGYADRFPRIGRRIRSVRRPDQDRGIRPRRRAIPTGFCRAAWRW